MDLINLKKISDSQKGGRDLTLPMGGLSQYKMLDVV